MTPRLFYEPICKPRLVLFFLVVAFIRITGFFGMALGAGGRRLFRFVLFVELFVAAFAIFVQGFGVVFFYFLFFRKFFRGLFTLGCFAWYFVALDAFLDVVALFERGQRFAVLIMMAFAASIFV
jgi:hypothetical protein